MSKLDLQIKGGESLPLRAHFVGRYPFCGGIRNKSNRTQFRVHPRNAPVLSHGFDFANAKSGGMNE